MNSKFWLLIAAVISVMVLLMGWFVGISPKIDEMNAAHEQRANVDAQNVGFQATIDQLKADSEQIDTLKDELKELQVALPPDGELSTFLGQLKRLEDKSGVKLTSFSATTGVPFEAVPNGTDTVADPRVTPENLIVVSVDLKVTGSRAQVLQFVNDLQLGERLFLVNSFALQVGADAAEGYTGSISGFVYVLVDPTAPPPTVTPVQTEEPEPTPVPEG